MSNIVSEILKEHLAKIEQRYTKGLYTEHLTTIMSDVNGTLDIDEIGTLLDNFLCDWHKAGLPIKIATGNPEQDLPFEIARLLESDTPRDEWLIQKPFSFKAINPGMMFDNEPMLIKMINSSGGTGFDPIEAEEFLMAWHALTPELKAQTLKPFLKLHSQYYPKPPSNDSLYPEPL